MKILAIRGKNLASLEGMFEIDFTVEPLKSAGIFAITGCTGAGKSTILDALCLALFDDTPRTNRAKENIAILDVKDRLINQKDCRTVLRRGTGEGYAEVDFISLGGEKYRSRWMVKRARGKVDGSMQNSEIRLVNMSAKTEQQGRKTELLVKITQLIGLTFEQFTRSVLLAQGDFATFLKARQSEKAELLEKLTGTEIYSRISMHIYEKSKLAEEEYTLLVNRVGAIELLPEEILLELQAEKQTLAIKSSELKNEIANITQKMTWWEEERKLKEIIRQAEEQYLVLQEEVVKAAPRYQYLSRIEKVQEIRDTYYEWKHVLQQNLLYQSKRRQQLAEIEENQHALAQTVELLEIQEKAWEEFKEKVRQLEPQFIQARELDVKIKALQDNLTEYKRDCGQSFLAEEKLEKTLKGQEQQLMDAKLKIDGLQKWLEKHRIYAPLTDRAELVVNLLNDIQATSQQLQENVKILTNCQKLQEQEEERQVELQREAERLQQVLPAEILTWRARLQEGVPCPVCGSIHHPYEAVSEAQTLREEELEKAREEVVQQIAKVQTRLLNRQQEITRLKTLIENYSKHAEQIKKKVDVWLTVLPDWQISLEQGTLQNWLKELVKQWKQYTDEHVRLNEHFAKLQLTVEMGKANLLKSQEDLKLKEAKNRTLTVELEKLHQERNSLLKGKAVDTAERACNERKKVFEEQIKNCTERRNILKAKLEACQATAMQTEQEIERLAEYSRSLQEDIGKWLTGQSGEYTKEDLAELFARDLSWLQEEKRFLNQLREKESAAKVTLAERHNNLLRHRQVEYRPQPETETEDCLQISLQEKRNKSEQTSLRLAEIEVALNNHQKGKAKRKSFEQELSEKKIQAENWKKLNELFGSASGSRFKEIAQGYTLDVLLVYANKHLQALSERYRLQRIPDTLALQVKDWDMLGENRAVHSLSGGESFLISLALALGLASLSSNRMNVESLFIDEGFGSLDADTLRVAMDALERLQNQGRKIGVISHVVEVTERISVCIQVVKSSNGRSEIRIVGS